MTQVKAQLKYLRIAPRKVRLVADLIRKKTLKEAASALNFMPNRSARVMAKLLKSAQANASNNFNLNSENLYVKEVRIDQGPVLKRFMPKARGMAHPIRKKASHITLVLEDKK